MKKSLLSEVRKMQKIAGLLKENEDSVQKYDEAIKWAYEMTPELMYEDGEFGDDVESLIQAEEEFKALLQSEEINPGSTHAYKRYWNHALYYAKDHGVTDLEDFKNWFKDTAVESEAYLNVFDSDPAFKIIK